MVPPSSSTIRAFGSLLFRFSNGVSLKPPNSFTLHLADDFIFLEDQSSTFGSYYVDFSSTDELFVKEEHCTERTWPSSLREYSLGIVGKRKSASIISQPEEIFWTEMSAILCAIGPFQNGQTRGSCNWWSGTRKLRDLVTPPEASSLNGSHVND
ncbi:protein RST1 [Forsythia ovata]|uniref:Protein RST1 n=1 Tax=Forsythia ovata TaxID=205694 RepID=A0ABD1WCK0_9LAMI